MHETAGQPDVPLSPPPGVTDAEFDAWVVIDDASAVAEDVSEEEVNENVLAAIISDIKTSTEEASLVSEHDDDDDEEEEVPTPTIPKCAVHVVLSRF